MVMYTMLDIKIGQLVELSDNNEYSVVSRVENNEKTYYRLSDINNLGSLKICYEQNDRLYDVEDKEELEKIIVMVDSQFKGEFLS